MLSIREASPIVSAFCIVGEPVNIMRYGNGHIHDTYVVTTMSENTSKRYILQRINNYVFKDIDGLMENIERVTAHIIKKTKDNDGNVEKNCLRLVPTKSGASYLLYEGNYYRMYHFIEGATTYSVVKKPEHFYQAAIGFANFQKSLNDFDATKLHEAIKDFHNTVARYEQFEDALSRDEHDRAKELTEEIAFIKARKDYCPKIVDMLKSGEIPTRVTHNDTKLNNVMIDDLTDRACAVIDLDTLMPGSLLYDFGDAIRFGCNPTSEDESRLDKVVFNIDLFELFAKGYVGVLSDTLTDKERENLAFSAILITFETGIRFVTDYLNGDVYFHTKYEGQNLRRAHTQFKLVKDMEENIERMNDIISRI